MVYLVAMVEIDLSVGGIFAVASSLPALLIKFCTAARQLTAISGNARVHDALAAAAPVPNTAAAATCQSGSLRSIRVGLPSHH